MMKQKFWHESSEETDHDTLGLAAILYGRKFGALARGLGMALFDVVGGWFLWAPFTLVIVGLMGYTVGAICDKRQNLTAYVLVLAAA
jgi:uncharacterized membrane protein